MLNMRKGLLVLFVTMISVFSFSQNDCYTRLEKAFDERGSDVVSEGMHRNVIISFFLPSGETICYSGKVRVENGRVESIFLYLEDDAAELMEPKFYNSFKKPPAIENGISEIIFNSIGEKFRIVFIDLLKPKKKKFKPASLPDDL